MKPRLRVYGWTAYYLDGVEREQHNHSFWCVVAATSKDEVARIANVSRPSRLWNLTITMNLVEITTAMAKPGTVFYVPDHLYGDRRVFAEVPQPTRTA